jgi:hypothetical protein
MDELPTNGAIIEFDTPEEARACATFLADKVAIVRPSGRSAPPERLGW